MGMHVIFPVLTPSDARHASDVIGFVDADTGQFYNAGSPAASQRIVLVTAGNLKKFGSPQPSQPKDALFQQRLWRHISRTRRIINGGKSARTRRALQQDIIAAEGMDLDDAYTAAYVEAQMMQFEAFSQTLVEAGAVGADSNDDDLVIQELNNSDTRTALAAETKMTVVLQLLRDMFMQSFKRRMARSQTLKALFPRDNSGGDEGLRQQFVDSTMVGAFENPPQAVSKATETWKNAVKRYGATGARAAGGAIKFGARVAGGAIKLGARAAGGAIKIGARVIKKGWEWLRYLIGDALLTKIGVIAFAMLQDVVCERIGHDMMNCGPINSLFNDLNDAVIKREVQVAVNSLTKGVKTTVAGVEVSGGTLASFALYLKDTYTSVVSTVKKKFNGVKDMKIKSALGWNSFNGITVSMNSSANTFAHDLEKLCAKDGTNLSVSMETKLVDIANLDQARALLETPKYRHLKPIIEEHIRAHPQGDDTEFEMETDLLDCNQRNIQSKAKLNKQTCARLTKSLGSRDAMKKRQAELQNSTQSLSEEDDKQLKELDFCLESGGILESVVNGFGVVSAKMAAAMAKVSDFFRELVKLMMEKLPEGVSANLNTAYVSVTGGVTSIIEAVTPLASGAMSIVGKILAIVANVMTNELSASLSATLDMTFNRHLFGGPGIMFNMLANMIVWVKDCLVPLFQTNAMFISDLEKAMAEQPEAVVPAEAAVVPAEEKAVRRWRFWNQVTQTTPEEMQFEIERLIRKAERMD